MMTRKNPSKAILEKVPGVPNRARKAAESSAFSAVASSAEK